MYAMEEPEVLIKKSLLKFKHTNFFNVELFSYFFYLWFSKKNHSYWTCPGGGGGLNPCPLEFISRL